MINNIIEFNRTFEFFFFRYPMVTYCHDSPKLCVGTKTGVLALYDLKTPKYQVRISQLLNLILFVFHLAISSSSKK